MSRAVAALGLLLLGAVVGLAAVAVHAWVWGLVLGIVATLAGVWAVPSGWLARPSYAVGWWVVLALALTPRHTGAYWVGGDARGYVLVGAGLALVVVTTATLPLGRRGRGGRRGRAASDSGSGDAR